MLHRVVRPFPYSEDGLTLVDLNVGDERDFGDMAGGLVAEGWVETAVEAVVKRDDETAPAVKPAKRK